MTELTPKAAASAAEAVKVQEGVVPPGFKPQSEGQATILQQGNETFYNPAQVINRDLSIAVLKYFIQQRQEEAASQGGKKNKRRQKGAAAVPAPKQDVGGITVLEGLAASGLRAIRYAKEVEGIGKVVANDLDPAVVESMRRNIEFNGELARAKVQPNCGDARLVMMQNPGAYDAVDLDPYGSPTTLLDSAVQAVGEGGLLLVTATDMAVLCGNNGEACFAKYGSYPLHRPYCHEMALRILLACIQTHAARYKRYIVPVLSLSIDFYIRVFVRVYTSANEVKNSATKLGYVYQSQGCDSFYWQRVGRKMQKGNGVKYTPGLGPAVPQQCPETGAGFSMGGPFWAEPLHDQGWVAGVLQLVQDQRDKFPAFDKIRGILTAVAEELPDVPLYYNVHDICKTVHCTSPRAEVLRSALLNAGYRVSSTHANPLGLKTDAPPSVLWDIIRCWVLEHPVKPPKEGSAAAQILGKQPELKADFTRATGAVSQAKRDKVARFLPNEPHWGPKSKHGRVLYKPEEAQAGGSGNGAAAAAGAGDGDVAVEEAPEEEQQGQQQQGQEQAAQEQAAAPAGAPAGAGAEEMQQ